MDAARQLRVGRGLHEEVRDRRGRVRNAATHPEGVVPPLRRHRCGGDAIAHEEIGSGHERAHRRLPGLLVCVALLIGIGAVGNSYLERRELSALLHRADAAQSTVAYTNHRIAATVDYARPQLFAASVPADVRTGLQQLVQDSAGQQVPALKHEREQVATTAVVPWHGSLRSARDALLRYLDARISYLRTITTQPDTLYVEQPELERLLDDTRTAFRGAAGANGRLRVDAVFAGGTHPG